ncbi:MAG TPA: helix-turn-helix domain-containing protein [Burkholderiales bacterium]|jgi:two-component system response regulator FlrC
MSTIHDNAVGAAGERDGMPVENSEDLVGTVTRLAGRMDLKTLERLYILRTLESVNGSRKMAVALLGISERTLRHKLRLYRTQALN